jgi:hypothetical protein
LPSLKRTNKPRPAEENKPAIKTLKEMAFFINNWVIKTEAAQFGIKPIKAEENGFRISFGLTK